MKTLVCLTAIHLAIFMHGCRESNPAESRDELSGTWVGQIASNPMRMEIQNWGNGLLSWEVGNPVHVANISGAFLRDDGLVRIEIVRFGTRTTIAILTGKKSGNTMNGQFVRLSGDVALPDSGSWSVLRTNALKEIYGEWSWVRSVGGIAGWVLTPPPNERIEYSKDHIFSRYRNDTLMETSSFWFVRELPPIFGSNTLDVVRYCDSVTFPRQAFEVSSDSLVLTDLFVDGYVHTYARRR